MWASSGGEPSLRNGRMTSNQKGAIQPVDVADGFVRLVINDKKSCMST